MVAFSPFFFQQETICNDPVFQGQLVPIITKSKLNVCWKHLASGFVFLTTIWILSTDDTTYDTLSHVILVTQQK